jgi:hypothetical protein
MIKLSINQSDLDNLNKQISMKIEAIGLMTKPAFTEEVAKAAFTITGERFMNAVDRHAALNPKAMHHVYEWNNLGNPSARLFFIKKTGTYNGNLIITSEFKKSRIPVPVNPELLIPGKSGKYVNRKNIFANKAQVMESGQQITYEAQRMLAFYGRTGLKFLKPGTVVNIKNPGGVATKNAFTKFMIDWYNSNAQAIMDSSGLYERIVKETSMLLSSNDKGLSDVKMLVARISDSVSQGKVVIQ